MPNTGVFREVVMALLDLLPAEVEVVGVEVSADADLVTIWTTTPKEMIGRRGAIASEVTRALSAALGRKMEFRVELPDGDIYGVPTTYGNVTEGPNTVSRVIGGPATPRPRIWRYQPSPEELAGSIVPPEWG